MLAQDLNFTGGVIHVIDSLLTLPQNVTATAVAANLTSLAGALTQTELLQAVNDLSDVTIFAPNNAAFQSIGSALPNLTAEDISSILTYHVVNGTVGYSSTLMDNMTLPTLNGGNVTINIQNGSVFVNGAQVVVPDVLVANGVIHVIDNVLNPNNTSAAPEETASSGSAAFPGASSASEPPFTSGLPEASTTIGSGAPAATGAEGSGASPSASPAAAPMITGAVGAAALFGAGAVIMNI
ncbi:hypothetical protein LTS18_004064 [Coniosporium uncinatum]|uniref:Uncharacterized protein n=1 Tax=Coniosporium uncinatum TaxID=93489 RepID=A0ACC3D638_9PEZI|nr:hypothetical protein LTS18_004064 [Coniosporium uncinatum]